MSESGTAAIERTTMGNAIFLFARQFEAMGMKPPDAATAASQMVNEAAGELRAQGTDFCKANRGDELAGDPQYVAPRLAAGLTAGDIRAYWNRPLLVIAGEQKMRELLRYFVVRTAAPPGKVAPPAAVEAALRRYDRDNPRYGEPATRDADAEQNGGLRHADADLYLEFTTRVNAWAVRVPDAVKGTLIGQHGTFNAVIRHLVAQGTV